MIDQLNRPLNSLCRDGPHRVRRTVTEFRVQLRVTERQLGRAGRTGRFQGRSAAVRASDGDLRPALGGVVPSRTLEAGRQREDAWVVDGSHFPNADFAKSEGGSHQEGGTELGFYHLRWPSSGRASPELIPIGLRIRCDDDFSKVSTLMRGGQI